MHAYTSANGNAGITRLWLPCLDHLHEKCSWEMEYVIPDTLEYMTNNEADSKTKLTVASSGDFVTEVEIWA